MLCTLCIICQGRFDRHTPGIDGQHKKAAKRMLHNRFLSLLLDRKHRELLFHTTDQGDQIGTLMLRIQNIFFSKQTDGTSWFKRYQNYAILFYPEQKRQKTAFF
ncbi:MULTISPECIES: hypothetical protein [Komagataeibacter]|uniref:hypothetical protein n=1 Tax=Komagataeibacter TaxID=1434011 RepID=UPI00137915EC|nr:MULTISPECIES: hypothetical protein [Komagataeibacter]MBV1825220.1 hypothetical protein [Komagataeibacter oboediens]